MKLIGHHSIGGRWSAIRPDSFQVKNAATGELLPTSFAEATESEVDSAFRLANESFDELQGVSREQIAVLLDTIATDLESAADALLECAHAETALPMQRLLGERTRTVGQTRRFAQLVREGSWVQGESTVATPIASRCRNQTFGPCLRGLVQLPFLVPAISLLPSLLLEQTQSRPSRLAVQWLSRDTQPILEHVNRLQELLRIQLPGLASQRGCSRYCKAWATKSA